MGLPPATAAKLSKLRQQLPRIAIALAVGAAGGALFAWLRLPLAWMIGAMTATTIAAVAGLPVLLPAGLRTLMMVVLGVLLGSAFTPDLLERVQRWSGSLVALAGYVAISTAVTWQYYRRIGRYDRTTAVLAAAPGGLAEMVQLGAALGADVRAISLSHGLRILLIVLIVPFGFQLLGGYTPAARAPAVLAGGDFGLLVACGAAGYLVARWLRLPAAALIGPMALSAAAHLTGLTDSRPPAALIGVAQIVVGSAIGCRFAGVAPRQLLRALLLGFGAALILLATTVAFSVALHRLTGLPVEALLLAFAPGGVAEMSLIALALGIDAAFVSTLHVARIFMIVVLLPAAFALMNRQRRRGG